MSDEDVCCKSGLHVRHGPWNRHAVASRRFSAGAVVAENAPLSYCLERCGERCSRCFGHGKDGGSLSRCSRCRVAHYCCRSCQKEDWKKHKLECKVLRDSPASDQLADTLLLLRTYVELDSASFADGADAPGDCTCRCREDGIIECGSKHFHSMAAASTSANSFNATDRQIIQVVAARCKNWTEEDVAKAMRIFRVNNFGITDQLHATMGRGVYPHGALLNHSCYPNCILRYSLRNPFFGPVMQIVAIRDIEKGEELTHSYVDIVQPTPTRQLQLESVHGFRCDCKRCCGLCRMCLPVDYVEQPFWPLQRGLERGIVCPDAEAGKNTGDEGLVDMELDEIMTHIKGGEINRSKDAIRSSQLKQAEAQRHMYAGDLAAELRCHCEAVSMLHGHPNVCSPFSVHLYAARGAYLSTLLVSGETEEALVQCQHIVSFLCVAFHHVPFHPLLGLQLYTLGDLYVAVGELERGRKAHAWAKKIMQVSHGVESEMLQKLKESAPS